MKKLELLNALLFIAALMLPQWAQAASIQRVESRFGCVAGEALTEGDILVMKSDGKCYKADADDSTLRPAIGVAGFTAASAANVSVVTRGQVGGLSSLTKGADVFLSTTAGGNTQTEPASYSQKIAVAISATQFAIQIGVPVFVSPSKISLPMRNETGGALAAGDLVYVSGWNETQKRFLVSKADADASGARAAYVMQGSLANNTNGFAYRTYRLTALDTSGTTVGDPVYLHTTAGGWTASAPTGADDINQIVGRVAVVHATTGEVELDLVSNNSPISVGTNELQALAITAAKIANTTITATQLATDAVTTVKITAANVTSTKASTPLKTRSAIIHVPDPGGADADITAGYVLWRPSVNVTVTKIEHIPQAAWVAAAPANDATVVLTNAAVGALATLAVQTALAAGSVNDMGAITNAAVVANTSVTIAVTANGTANAPAAIIQIEYTTGD